jgi:peptidyl-prolyl cis-trans isomerase D
MVLRVKNVTNPSPLSFELAKSSALDDLIEEKKIKRLEELAKKELNSFNGIDIGYVNAFNKIPTVDGLESYETKTLIDEIFANSEKNSGYKLFGDEKVVVYKIDEQRFASNEEKQDEIDSLYTQIDNIKNDIISSELIKNLENRYRVESAMLGEEGSDKE